jgi:hypothetical protein
MELGVAERRDMSKVTCYNCGKKGHIARYCRSPRKDQGKGSRPHPEAQEKKE